MRILEPVHWHGHAELLHAVRWRAGSEEFEHGFGMGDCGGEPAGYTARDSESHIGIE